MPCRKEVHRKQGITRHQVHKDIENAQYGVSNNTHILHTQGVILLRFYLYSFAFSLEGGTDLFLTNHIALSLEGRYTGGYASNDIVVKCRELSIAHKILMLSLF